MVALKDYNRMAADLHARRAPRSDHSDDIPSAKDRSNDYLPAREKKATRELIVPSYFDHCRKTVTDFATCIGKERTWDDMRRSIQRVDAQ